MAKTGIPPEELNMHSYEIKRKEYEERLVSIATVTAATPQPSHRDALERAMPELENGKGHRYKSEFWQQSPQTRQGLNHTLTKVRVDSKELIHEPDSVC